MSDSTSDAANQAVGQVLGRIPSGVFILTAADAEGRETGMLASWVQQAGFEPPCITVGVNHDRYLNGWLEQNPYVALNLVGDGQFEWLKHFGKGFEPDEDAFSEIAGCYFGSDTSSSELARTPKVSKSVILVHTSIFMKIVWKWSGHSNIF